MKKERIGLLLYLFRSQFAVSAFTFGGGYVVIPIMRKYYVENRSLIEEEELLNMAAIAQSSPGAIAINLAVLTGYRLGGKTGALVSAFASVLPPFLILSVISVCYQAVRDNALISAVLKGMEAGVAALIVDLVLDMGRKIFKEKQLLCSLLVPGAFAASFLFEVNVALILIVSALLCLAEGLIRNYRREGRLWQS